MKIRGRSLQQKILLSLLLVVAVFTVTGAVGYRFSLKNGYDLTIEAVDTSLQHINREADVLFGEIQARAQEAAGNPDLQAALREELPESLQEIYRQRLNFNNWLYYEKIRVKQIDGMYVLGENGALFHSNYSFRKDEYRDAWWYKRAVDEKQTVWIEPHSGSELGKNLDFLTMSIVVPIQDRASTRILGVLAAETRMDDLTGVIFEDPAFNGIICIADEIGNVIYRKDPGKADDRQPLSDEEQDLFNEAIMGFFKKETGIEKNGHTFLDIEGKEFITVYSGLSDSPWKLVCLVPSSQVLADTFRLRTAVILSGIALVLFGIAFSFYTSSGLVKPVRDMRQVMKQVENGDFSVRVQNPGEDELGDLSRGLNHMIGRVDELMLKERETQEKLKKADFNALQSQINPHFLYNTLDSINWMARMGRTDQVEQMIDSLTSFLRIGLSRGQTFISLKEELKHVESYFTIQKVRYHSLLNYEIQVPESLFHYQMIKMTLQPLVENALYHGIKEKDEPGTIRIRAVETEEDLVITVEDDGLGMTSERLSQVTEMMRTGTAQNKDAYGIINVQRRIRSYFGEEYGLKFESEYRKGTTVTLTLPKREKEETNV